MYFKNRKEVNKSKKKLLKKCRKYEKIDNEFKSYIESMIIDPRVVQIHILGSECHGIAGFNEYGKIEYIWIFRNQRGQNLSGAYCNKYGVCQPTKEIIHNMIVDSGLTIEEPYILMDGKELWNIKYGFVVTDCGFLGSSIEYNEYNYGKGTFKTLTSFIPLSIHEIDLFELEKCIGEQIKNIGKGNKFCELEISKEKIMWDDLL